MRSFNKAVLAAFGFGAVAGIAAGCQVYDFEPVVPLTFQQYSESDTRFGRALKPNLMLMVDKSGSMDLPADSSDGDCVISDGGICGVGKTDPCNTSVCPTRWSELQGAMDDFLSTRGDVARMGLTVYPTNATCGAVEGVSKVLVPIDQSEDDSASMIATANQINTVIQGISSIGVSGSDTSTGGGTPTGGSVSALAALADLNGLEREDLILVLTDGLPNCNPTHATPAPSPDCRCTLSGGVCSGSNATRGCLDKNATVQAITGARGTDRATDIRTVVVGFGADLVGGDAPEVLNAMALAGGFPRSCNIDGGSPACPAGESCQADATCSETKYFQASNRADLASALAAIADTFGNPCEYTIEQNPENNDERLIVVYLTQGESLRQRLVAGPDTFTFSPGLVTLVGETCSIVSNATPENKVTVEIRVLQSL